MIHIHVGAATVNAGDSTPEDPVDVQELLNNSKVEVLNNVLNNGPIAGDNRAIPANLLRDADTPTDVQVVAGVLNGGWFVTQ